MQKGSFYNILQKGTAMIMIFMMLFSYLPILSFAQEENEENVVFSTQWNSANLDEENVLNAYTNSSYNIKYNIKLNNIQNGFKNLTLTVTNKAGEPVANFRAYKNSETETVENGQYSIISFGNKNTGKEFSGEVNVSFANSDDIYNKEIVLTLTGTYVEKGETVSFKKQETLNATVTPSTTITGFYAYVTEQTDSYGNTIPSSVGVSKSMNMGYKKVGKYTRSIGWYATEVTASYPIRIYSYRYTQKLKLDITIARTVGNEDKLQEGFEIDWNGLDTEFGEPSQKTNEDGSITYTFCKGNDGNQLVENETFSIQKDYNIRVVYNIPNTNPENGGELKEDYTNCKFLINMEAIGYRKTKEFGKEEEIKQETIKKSFDRNNLIGLYSYTPGNHAWISASVSTSGKSYLEEEQIEQIAEEGGIDLSFNTNIDNSCNYGDAEKNVEAYLIYGKPVLTYLSDSGKIQKLELNNSQMRLSSIKETNTGTSYFVSTPNNIEQEIDNIYEIQSDINVSTYKIKIKDFLSEGNDEKFNSFSSTYRLNSADLPLSKEELKNIISIEVNISTSGSRWCKANDIATYYNINSLGNKYSYMEFKVLDFDSDISMKNKEEFKNYTFRMYKNKDRIYKETLSVVNKNPVFYVNMPSEFSYSNIEVNITENPYISINTDKTHFINIDGEKYLVIECEGIYDSSKQNEVDISISFSRKLISNSIVTNKEIKAYMLTDNERYFYETENSLRVQKNNIIPEKVFSASSNFDISGGKTIETITTIQRTDNTGVCYQPNPSNSDIEFSEKQQPVIVDSNNKIIYSSEIICAGDTLNNVSIISRLPKADNKYINDNQTKILEDGFTLPEDFCRKYGDKINGFSQEDTITQVSLENIENIKVLKNGSEEVSKDFYKLYYSLDENADFSSDNFIEYEENSDLSQAKNLKVVFNSNYSIYTDNKYSLQYEMTMPNKKGMVGGTTAVKYTKSSDGQESILYSPAAYVINGITTGTINVTKKFEGYSAGIAPEGVNISGIEFKLQYYNNETNEKEFLKNTNGEDIVAITNDQGKATFENIPYGEYYLYEVTEFEKYDKIGNLYLINLEAAEKINVIAENKLKRGNLTIYKRWSNTNINQGQVKFNVKRNTNNTIRYETEVVTNEDGYVNIVGIPYGQYTITETECIPGWISTGDATIEIDKEENVSNMVNRPGYSSLQIIKTVPVNETVDGLTFNITGFGIMNYVDSNNQQITNNTDLKIKVGEDYSNTNGKITVVKSNEDRVATITINNLPLGYYNIQEVDMPIIEGTDIEKYVTVEKTAHLSEDISKTNKPVSVSISNEYKYGTLEIHKTAKLKEGDNYTNIGDLTGIQVLVSGTSYYGTSVNKVMTLDENGYASEKFEIGQYKIQELNTDGYTVYYGKDSSASTESPTVTIKYNEKTNQYIYNEHTGVGYVRVEKTLEGVTDPQKVVNAGIKFQVYGQNVAGGRVNEIISIDKIDTEKNVAYGISNAIPTEGEYRLEEVDDSVPNYYEKFEGTDLNLKTCHTLEEPLVISALNTRTKGNLEIITKTKPEGGMLQGIKYNVTEVSINSNGTFERLGDAVELEGYNGTAKTSFAEMKEINAGYYLVEQTEIPDGWIKDVSQIVEVPSYNTGYANFEITKRAELQDNRVIINKLVLNKNGEPATDEDYQYAKLDRNEQFEVRLTNVLTGENYYVFVGENNRGVIQGLDAGTYRIEEVYKPKYITEGYYQKIELQSNLPEESENIISDKKIEETNGEYYFTIGMNDNTLEDIEITVKNIINPDFGFGGQYEKNNLNKKIINEEEVVNVTKTVIYVVDEDENAISGAKFRLLNSEGKVMCLNSRGEEFEIANKKLTIRGLEEGIYTLECVQVPTGYLKPANKKVIVFDEATQVVKVEIQKNIPRGSIRLSTTYIDEDEATKYVSRSKYKIVDNKTGEILKFERTSTGDYRKTNLSLGTSLLVLKSGEVEIDGIETGVYDIGIVDITKGFGINNKTPEYVEIKENEIKDVNVQVSKKKILQVQAGYQSSLLLNESGEIYGVGYKNNGIVGSTDTATYRKLELPPDVKIKKISYENQTAMALDKDGNVWGWGYSGNGSNGLGSNAEAPTLVSGNKSIFTDISCTSETGVALDKDGNVWVTGYYTGDGTGERKLGFDTPVIELVNKGIKVKKLATMRGYSSNVGVIDTDGRIWMWGSNYKTLIPQNGSSVYSTEYSAYYNGQYYQPCYKPKCISEVAGLQDVCFEELALCDNFAMALDSEGNIWLWGDSGIIEGSLLQGVYKVPTKANMSLFDNKKIKSICANTYNSQDWAAAIDVSGKLWLWGYGATGQLATGRCESIGSPICVSNIEGNILNGKQIESIVIANYSYKGVQVLALDNQAKLYAWGGYSDYGEAGESSSEPITIPREIKSIYYDEHFEYNVKFREVFSRNDISFAIDEQGRLWGWGYNSNNVLGIKDSYNITVPTIIKLKGNPKIKKFDFSRSTSVALSEDGRIFLSGQYAYDGLGKKYDYAVGVEVTDTINIPQGRKIVDIYITGSWNCWIIAVDSEGDIYRWGMGQTLECISDTEDRALHGIKIKGFFSYDSNNGTNVVISEEGDLYYWIANGEPKLIDSGHNFVDIQGYYLLDSAGKIWTMEYYNINTPYIFLTCQSDKYDNPIYIRYQTDPKFKFVKLYNAGDYGYEACILVDSYGKLWRYSYTGVDLVELNGTMDVGGSDVKADLMPKKFISLSGWLLVDEYGQIWVYKNNSNYYGQAGNGTTTRIENPMCLSQAEQNNVYNVRMKKIISGNYVADENGNLFEFREDKNSMIIGKAPLEYMEGALKLKFVSTCSNEMDSAGGISGVEAIGIDEEGHLWEANINTATDLSTVQDSELAKKYEEDSNFKIEKIYMNYAKDTYYTCLAKYAIDNYGKLWTWGYNQCGQCGNGNTTNVLSPICISDLENVEINNVESLEFSGHSVIAKDKNENIWVWGENTDGKLGNGLTTNITIPFNITTSKLDNKKVKEIIISKAGMLLCEDGSVYISGDTNVTGKYEWTNVGTCEGAEKIFNKSIYVITGNNKVWTLGYNNPSGNVRGMCGTGDASENYIKTPTLISENFTVSRVADDHLYWAYRKWMQVIVDTNGKIWYWGGETDDTVIAPVCENNSEPMLDCLMSSWQYLFISKNGKIRNEDGMYDTSTMVKTIYGDFSEEHLYDFMEKIMGSNPAYIIQNGKAWEVSRNNYSLYQDSYVSFTYNCLTDDKYSDLYGKNVVDIKQNKAIDEDGNLYVWGKSKGIVNDSKYPVCTTKVREYQEAMFKANNTIVNVPEENKLQNVKIKDLINDKFVTDENDNIWYFIEDGKAININEEYRQYENPLAGKDIKKIINEKYVITEDDEIWYIGGNYPGYTMDAVSEECRYVMMSTGSVGYEYYIALDKNGKIWACGVDRGLNGLLGTGNYNTNKKPVCLNDIEGTELYTASMNDPEFRIENVLFRNSCLYAIDNKGKLWAWGYGSYIGDTIGANRNTPICLSNIGNTDLYNAYQHDETFKITDVVLDYVTYLKDSNNEIWTLDSSTKTWRRYRDYLLNGALETAYNSDDFQIEKILPFSSSGRYGVIGNDKKLYISSPIKNNYLKMDVDNVITAFEARYSYEYPYRNYRECYYQWIAVAEDGIYMIKESWEEWAKKIGTNSYGPWELQYYNLKKEKIATLDVKQFITSDNRTAMVLDNSGKVWVAGYLYQTLYGWDFGTNPTVNAVCLSNNTNYPFYEKQIDQILTVNNRKYLKDIDGNMYLLNGEQYTNAYESLIEQVYGEVNDENTNAFYDMLNNNAGYIKFDNNWYYVDTDGVNAELVEKHISDDKITLGRKYIKVVGEDEVQVDNGKIYRINPTSDTTIEMVECEEVTPFTQEEVAPITIENVNIIKQTQYKALDSNGNLYVWDKYKGLATNTTGVICLTNENYYIKPVYVHADGWSIIQNQL